jgi:RND family efflux transporter MFP subunit
MKRPRINPFVLLIDTVVPLAIIVGAILGMRALILSRPEPPMEDRPPQAALVRVARVDETSPQVWMTAHGTVQPAREVALRSQVSGIVVRQNDRLITGGLLSENEEVLRIDPRDYEYQVQQREAALVAARADLKMEEGRQIVAEREWELLESTLPDTPAGSDLALRVPFREEKEAAVRSAESQLAQARLNLERTVIRAPFNSLVIEESVELGQYLGPQDVLARLIGTDTYFIEASVPTTWLAWVAQPSPDSGGQGARVEIMKDRDRNTPLVREGRIVGLLGDVDPQGRMARLRVELPDPLGLAASAPDGEPFLVGDYVRVRIEGPVVEHALEIPRLALREDDRVWVMSPDATLDIRKVEVLHRQEDSVIVHGGLEPDENIVVSNLTEAVPGMALTTDPDAAILAAEPVSPEPPVDDAADTPAGESLP